MRTFAYTLNIIFLFFLYISNSCGSEGVQSHTSIINAAHNYLTSKLRRHDADFDISISRLDNRLKLPRCDEALKIFLPHSRKLMGKVTIGVRCSIKKPWTIYVSGTIRLYRKIAVLTTALPRATTLTYNDVALQKRDVSTLRKGYFTRLEQVVNKQLKRSLSENRILNASLLASQKVIKRGQKVSIRAVSNSMDIRMAGKALMDGEQGQLIRVLNNKSKRIIEGTVIAPGVVHVRL